MTGLRHVRLDRLVAVVEIISPGNETGCEELPAVAEKARQLLEHRIHLLILDLFPPSKRDPDGVHAAIRDTVAEEPFTILLAGKAIDDGGLRVGHDGSGLHRARCRREPLPEMPLLLEPGAHTRIPLEATYQAAIETVPARWPRVLEVPAD